MTLAALTPSPSNESAAPAVPPPSRLRVTTIDWVAGGLVLVLALSLWMPRLFGPIDLRYDAGVYYVLGTSLATGQGYRLLNEPGAPAAVQYPPGLPALVAVHQWALGTSDSVVVGRWLRRTYCLLFLGYAAGLYFFARCHLGPPFAALASALCLLQANTYLLSDLLFAELPFGLTLVLLAWNQWKARQHATRWSEARGWLLASAAFLFRTAGLAALAAWVLEAAVRRRWRQALLRAGLAAVPFLGWQGYVGSVRAQPSYAQPAYAYQRAPYQMYNVTYAENIVLKDPFRPAEGSIDAAAVLQRLRANVAEMPTAIGETVSSTLGFWKWAFNTLQDNAWGTRSIDDSAVVFPLVVLSLLITAGLAALAWRGDYFTALCALLSIALVCVTPWPGQFARYLAPLSGLFAVAAVLALIAIWDRARTSRLTMGLLGAPVLLSLVLAMAVQVFAVLKVFERRKTDPGMLIPWQGAFAAFYHGPSWASWEKAVLWLADSGRTVQTIATTAPHLCYLWTGKPAVFPPMEADPARARSLLDSVPVSHVIVDQLEFLDISRVFAEPAVAAQPATWQRVYSENGTDIYERR